ncbi:IPT/TIG domain-containing protein [Prosthecobacter sp.]|uniref:IPT/TIG domain-containing protein n=1 Tax=Prosthecobacter sp. TaxID=1965333 RepID=UPI003784F32D
MTSLRHILLALILALFVSEGAAAAPTVTSSTANQLSDAITLTINGTGFDATTPGNNIVVFDNIVAYNNGGRSVVTAATSTKLTLTFEIPPDTTGVLRASVSVNGLSSGPPVVVATLVQDCSTTTLTGLASPRALAFDSSGNLFVANSNDNTVSKFAPGTTVPSATLVCGWNPYALAFDHSDNLFVANFFDGTVSKFAPGVVSPSATLTGLGSPTALVFDSAGNLFVSNFHVNTVSKFAPGSVTPSATLSGLGGPVSLAFDNFGNLFVANYQAGTVSKFAPGATTPSATLTGLSNPTALAFDSFGSLFVTNSSADTVSKFAPGAITPSATLTGLGGPFSLAFDSYDNLFVANFHGVTVSKFVAGSTTPSSALTGVNPPSLTGINQPQALAFDRSGDLFVANGPTGTVSKIVFSPGMQIWRLNHFGTDATSANLADTESYVGDGLPNLLKYALGHSPLVTAPSSALPNIVQSSADPLLTDRLSLSFTLPTPPPADVIYTVQATEDLVNWSSVATKQGGGAWQWNTSAGGSTPHIVKPGTTPDPVLIGDVVPSNGLTRRMMRLQVTRP